MVKKKEYVSIKNPMKTRWLSCGDEYAREMGWVPKSAVRPLEFSLDGDIEDEKPKQKMKPKAKTKTKGKSKAKSK